MEKKTEKHNPDQWLKDLPTESEIRSFSAEEMISCEKCGRKCPPTRLKCLYCGEDLKVSDEQSIYLKPSLRKLEEWEKGFNVILLKNDFKLQKKSEVADLFHLQTEDLEKILEAKLPLPLARAETPKEAELLVKKLSEFGVESRIISDEVFNPDKSPRRLRGLEFYEDRLILILFNADEVAEIPYQNINLVVTGAFFERKIEATESIKKKSERKILNSLEISFDEMLIDIYSKTDSIGYRIESKGFDFSCLGAEKGLFAKENMPRIVEKIKSIAPNVTLDKNYLSLREEIGKVWSVSERNDTSNLKSKGIGGVKRTNITTINNLNQFTRYSRMIWHIL